MLQTGKREPKEEMNTENFRKICDIFNYQIHVLFETGPESHKER